MSGTTAKYMRHWRAGNPESEAYNRWNVRTRNRAMQRLIEEFPARFAELVAQERRAEPDPRLNGGSAT